MLAFSDAQLEQIKTAAFQLPHHLRSQFATPRRALAAVIRRFGRLALRLPGGTGDHGDERVSGSGPPNG